MQLRDPSSLTSEAYVAQRAWHCASLAGCPRHPAGGCGFARHGTYPRQTPAGMRIARYYCPTAHETFSLLPDCLASRFPGDLDDLERVVAHVEAARSIEAAADLLRPDIVLPSAVRWLGIPPARRNAGEEGRFMTDSRQLQLPATSHDEAVALFRYGLIADLLHLPPGHRRLQARLREKAEREYEIPGSARRRVAAETLRDWVYAYRRGGFDARPRPRRSPAPSNVSHRPAR